VCVLFFGVHTSVQHVCVAQSSFLHVPSFSKQPKLETPSMSEFEINSLHTVQNWYEHCPSSCPHDGTILSKCDDQ
jgi:hypothetical protein